MQYIKPNIVGISSKSASISIDEPFMAWRYFYFKKAERSQ